MRKWITFFHVVYYSTRYDRAASVSFSEAEAGTLEDAVKLAIATRNIRKQNIEAVHRHEHIIDLDKLGLALSEKNLPHGRKCICDRCLREAIRNSSPFYHKSLTL